MTARAPVVTLAVLAAYTCLRSTLVPDGWHDVTNVSMILIVAVLAASSSLGADELGLDRDRLGAGLRWGGTAAIAVLGAVALGLLVAPSIVDRLVDDPDATIGATLIDALVRIPVATVVLEELAFRGVLDAQLRRCTTTARATATGVAAFALWHVPGAWGDGGAAVVGVVAVTAVAGAAFLLLRHRSGSLVAPILAHWATNGGSLLLVALLD